MIATNEEVKYSSLTNVEYQAFERWITQSFKSRKCLTRKQTEMLADALCRYSVIEYLSSESKKQKEDPLVSTRKACRKFFSWGGLYELVITLSVNPSDEYLEWYNQYQNTFLMTSNPSYVHLVGSSFWKWGAIATFVEDGETDEDRTLCLTQSKLREVSRNRNWYFGILEPLLVLQGWR